MDDDMISVSGYSVASMPNRPYRKKRRAPLPPTASTNKTDDDKASVSVHGGCRSIRLDPGGDNVTTVCACLCPCLPVPTKNTNNN